MFSAVWILPKSMDTKTTTSSATSQFVTSAKMSPKVAHKRMGFTFQYLSRSGLDFYCPSPTAAWHIGQRDLRLIQNETILCFILVHKIYFPLMFETIDIMPQLAICRKIPRVPINHHHILFALQFCIIRNPKPSTFILQQENKIFERKGMNTFDLLVTLPVQILRNVCLQRILGRGYPYSYLTDRRGDCSAKSGEANRLLILWRGQAWIRQRTKNLWATTKSSTCLGSFSRNYDVAFVVVLLFSAIWKKTCFWFADLDQQDFCKGGCLNVCTN